MANNNETECGCMGFYDAANFQCLPYDPAVDTVEPCPKDTFGMSKAQQIGALAGNITMLIYALKTKSGFWKGFLLFGVGGLIGLSIGTIIDRIGKNK